MPRKPSKKEAPIFELADKLLRVLRSQRGLGDAAYPLSVRRLVELTDPGAAPAVLKKALARKTFLKEVALLSAKAPDAPIALAADSGTLAGSALTLEFLLRQTRTAATHAFTAAKLKKKATGKMQKPFQDAINRRIAEGTLPPTVGWVSISGRKMLLLLSDLHTTAGQPPPAAPAPAPPPPPVAQEPPAAPAPALDFVAAFEQAFTRLDRAGGGHNFVSLVALRGALSADRDSFDQGLRRLRQEGRYALSAAEGRDGISAEERAAGILEEGSLLLFVSRNSP
jgi:hypothetical protein